MSCSDVRDEKNTTLARFMWNFSYPWSQSTDICRCWRIVIQRVPAWKSWKNKSQVLVLHGFCRRFGPQPYLPETIHFVPEPQDDIFENELELGKTKSYVSRDPTWLLCEKGPYCSMHFVTTEACEAEYKGNAWNQESSVSLPIWKRQLIAFLENLGELNSGPLSNQLGGRFFPQIQCLSQALVHATCLSMSLHSWGTDRIILVTITSLNGEITC